MINVFYSSQFEKSFKKIPKHIARLFNDKQSLFILNLFNPLLKTHRLRGKLKEYYSFSINVEYRVLFKWVRKNKILLLDIGTHEIYKK